MVIDQRDIDDVKMYFDKYNHVPVDIKLDSLPHDTFDSNITALAQTELKVAPQRISTRTGGDLPTTTDPHSGVERPQSTSYQALRRWTTAATSCSLACAAGARSTSPGSPWARGSGGCLAHTFNFKL